MPGLIPPWSTSSLLYCTDCHSSDGSPSGSGPRGPHGSSWPFLLAREYRTADHTRESAQAYALCYTCHDRGTLLSKKQSGFPEHRKHVEGEDTPCSACHDPHGIGPGQGSPGSHSHLINFDLGIVGPDPKTGRLEFVDGGFRQGECYLECHGKKHGPKRYPD